MQARSIRLVAVAAGIGLGLLAYKVQVDNLGSNTTSLRAAASVIAAWSFLAAGIAAWSRRPDNLLGPLMVATCFALLARQLRYSHDELGFTVFFLFGELGYALIAHIALAYPSGRVTDRAERLFLKVAYVTALAFPLAILLVHDGRERLRYFDPLLRESVLVVSGRPELAGFLQDAYFVVAYGFLASIFIVLLARKFWRASPRMRGILAPLLLGAVVAALWAIYNSVVTYASSPPDFVVDNVFWWQIAALTALPIALFIGLVRSRLAHANMSDLVVKLENAPPSGIRDALAEALDDPTLEVALWLPERNEFVDLHGHAVPIPEDSADRAVTRIEQRGEPLAALIHDPSLRDEPELIDAAAAAARLALENARLHAELQAQLAKVKESRARIVAAGDEERRRIERAIHDGAQGRLVALGLDLQGGQRRLGGPSNPEVDRLLADASEELAVALKELRELASGVHPGILTQGGLAVALDALATKAPVPVTVDARLDQLPPEIEVTAYFVASEALANVAKHARASGAAVQASTENGTLLIEVADDGVGGAALEHGTGLRGLADRVEAQGGRLWVDSPPGGGTRVRGEIPCGS